MSKYSHLKILITILLIFALLSCSQTHIVIPEIETNPIVVPDSIVSVSIDQTKKGYGIPSAFQGLSYETNILSNAPSFLNSGNTVLIQMIKNLGPGVLRLGGNSSDDVLWAGGSRTASTPANSLTMTEIDNLSAFSKAIGWPVLFGFNMGTYDPAAAAGEAKYVANSLQGSLLAFQNGNEPDGYHSWNPKRSATYGYPEYKPEWESYFTAVRKVVPNVPFAGPDIAYKSDWVTPFAADEGKNVVMLDGHYYQNGPASDPAINISSLFTPIPQYTDYFKVINNASLSSNIPWRITECNSINGGGKSGVSDTFASALWALDFMWMVAENGGQGVNFHGGSGGAYSPFATSGGVPYARPIYYAFLAFKYGSEGSTIVPVTVGTTKYSYSAYACVKTGTTSLTLINKNAAKGLIFKVQLTGKATALHIARMTAQSIGSTSGVKFCNSSVNGNGTFQTGSTEDILVGGMDSSYVVVPAASAAIVLIQ